MKTIKILISFFVFLGLMNESSPQVGGRCLLVISTTLTKALSPYNVKVDLPVQAGMTLAIEPGVEIRYTIDYRLLIKDKFITTDTLSDT